MINISQLVSFIKSIQTIQDYSDIASPSVKQTIMNKYQQAVKTIETIIQDNPECIYNKNFQSANETNTLTGITTFTINKPFNKSFSATINIVSNFIFFKNISISVDILELSRSNIRQLISAYINDDNSFLVALEKYHIPYTKSILLDDNLTYLTL